VEKEKELVDDAIRERYGLPEDLKLLEDGDDEKAMAKDEWIRRRQELHLARGVKKRKLEVRSIGLIGSSGSGSVSSSSSAASSLKARILENTAKRSVAFNGSSRPKPPDRKLRIHK
jgi:coiled-coil domain-containing protein 130